MSYWLGADQYILTSRQPITPSSGSPIFPSRSPGLDAVATGWAIHKPAQLSWLTALFGGFGPCPTLVGCAGGGFIHDVCDSARGAGYHRRLGHPAEHDHPAGAQPLTVEHGAPLRLVVPVKLGLKNIKAITRITYTKDEPPDYWAKRGYSRYDGI